MDLKDLSYEELFDLHTRVVERLRFLMDGRRRAALERYQPGDRIRFDDGRGKTIGGVVVRVNKKSLTVDTPRGLVSGVPPFAVTEHIAEIKKSAVLNEILGRKG